MHNLFHNVEITSIQYICSIALLPTTQYLKIQWWNLVASSGEVTDCHQLNTPHFITSFWKKNKIAKA